MVESFFALLNNLEATFNPGNAGGLLVLFFLAAITDIGVPVPFVLDTILILTAYKVWTIPNSPWAPVVLIVLMLFFGRQLGSGLLYLISRLLGGKVFSPWLKRHVPSIGNRLDSFCNRMNHFAPLAVATGRLTPGLLQITSVAAGIIPLRYLQFAFGVAVASIIYDGLLVLLAFIAAHSPRASDANFTIWLLISLIVVVCILWPLIFIFAQRSNRKAALRLQVTGNSCELDQKKLVSKK
jgi:membrane protein DedA with SNARE-associated domain